MTEDTTSKDKISVSESSAQTTSTEDSSLFDKPEQAGDIPAPKESPAPDIDELKSMTAQLLELNKGNQEIISKLKEDLAEQKAKFDELSQDYESRKPLDRRAEVVGLFDWGKQKEIFANEHFKSQKEYAYKLLNDLDLEFPPA